MAAISDEKLSFLIGRKQDFLMMASATDCRAKAIEYGISNERRLELKTHSITLHKSTLDH